MGKKSKLKKQKGTKIIEKEINDKIGLLVKIKTKLNDLSKIKKGILGSVLGLGLLFMGYTSYNYYLNSRYEIGPKGEIYFSEWKSARNSDLDDLRNHIWEDMVRKKEPPYYMKISKFDFKIYDERNSITPLSQSYDIKSLEKIILLAEKEFLSYGLKSIDFSINPIYEPKDISSNSNKINLVYSINTQFRASINFLNSEDKLLGSVSLHGDHSNFDGETINNIIAGKKGKIYIKKIPIYIATKNFNDVYKRYNTIFSELLHSQTFPAVSSLFLVISEYKYDGKQRSYIYPNFSGTIEVNKVIEEGVVHGIVHSFIGDHLKEIGVSQYDFFSHIRRLEQLKYYKGSRYVRELCQKTSRSKVLKRYFNDSFNLAKEIVDNTPDYKYLESQLVKRR